MMSNSTLEMQVMVPSSSNFVNRARYIIHPTKSCVLSYWEQFNKSSDPKFIINGEEVSEAEQTKHLGITREVSNGVNSQRR